MASITTLRWAAGLAATLLCAAPAGASTLVIGGGAAYVGSSRYGEGLVEIDQGLALGVKDPQKAYFNRGIAHENLGDVTAAYRDYTKAAELDPDWDAPKNELTRFTVRRP